MFVPATIMTHGSRYIELAKNESYIRSQDYFTVLGYIAGSRVGSSIVWDWVRNNWQYLVDRWVLMYIVVCGVDSKLPIAVTVCVGILRRSCAHYSSEWI